MGRGKCSVCEGKWGGNCIEQSVPRGNIRFECDVCGSYDVDSIVLEDNLLVGSRKFNDVARAALCHFIRSNQTSQASNPFITSDWLFRFLSNAKLPTPGQQAINMVRFIGDAVEGTGRAIEALPIFFFASIGSPNPDFAIDIALQLRNSGILLGLETGGMGQVRSMSDLSLTLSGWSKFEAEKRGILSGGYGFIAMKFSDPQLDPFVKDVVKPAIGELGFTLIDMRDVARPGIIDNILREQIRDAAFVLVDLTHDNAGAYWEAGYAEGLGKPVLYLCQQTKFDEKKTHFDTNHCTTVTWGGGKTNDTFGAELRATLRNSLRLIPRS